MIDGPDQLSEEAAQRVWKRAADLQSAAADLRSRPPVVSTDSTESGHQTGYDLTQVRQAAAEVGIAPEFVALALAEEHDVEVGPADRIDRWAERLTGSEPRSLIVSRRFETPIDDVYAAVQRVFPSHHLTLIDAHGHALEGGLLVFALPSAAAAASGAATADFVASNLVTRARVEAVRLRLLPLGQASCVACLSASLGAARRAHLGLGATLSAGGGVVGGWAVGALGAALVLPLGIGSAAAAAVVGGAMLVGLGAGGSLGVASLRTVHRSSQRRGTAALERLLQAVGVELREGTASGAAAIETSSVNRGPRDRTRSTD